MKNDELDHCHLVFWNVLLVFWNVLFFASLQGSVCMVIAISIERYLRVCRPQSPPRKAGTYIAGVSIFILVAGDRKLSMRAIFLKILVAYRSLAHPQELGMIGMT